MKDLLDPLRSDAGHLSEPDRGLSAWLPLVEDLPMYFWESDPDHRFSFVSQGLERHLGLNPAERIGVPMMGGTRDLSFAGPRFQKHLAVLSARERYANFCFEKEVAPGQHAVLMTSGMPRHASDGTYLGLRGLTFNLTRAVNHAERDASLVDQIRARADALELELLRRNEEVEEANRLLTEVLDEMSEGLLVTDGDNLLDPDKRILMVNEGYRKLFGLEQGDVFPGQRLEDLIALLTERGDAVDGDDLNDLEHRLMKGDAVLMRIPSLERSYFARVTRRSAGGLIIMHNDVTELDQRNAELERARDAERHANHAKSNFLASMSHEIRTPMNGIIGMTDLLMQTALSPEQAEFVETIRNSAVSLTDLISDILDFSKIEAGHMNLERVPFGLHELAQDMSRMMTPMAEAKGLTFELGWDETLPSAIIGDKLRLRQILTNLVGNAIKFTEAGKVSLLLRKTGAGRLEILVSDTGIGIPASSIDTIFEVFRQVDNGWQREFEGTGLGLAITRQLAEGMGGTINVSSKASTGSCFTVDLPLLAVNREQPTPDRSDLEIPDLSEFKILLAEDNQTNQLVVRKMLGATGVYLDTVAEGQAACEAVAKMAYDLVLMDLSMPEMTGLEATEIIRCSELDMGRKPCAIVALTGNAFEADRSKCIAAGMNGFLTKPVRLATLIACLSEQLFSDPEIEIDLEDLCCADRRAARP